jgi:hypothetical protein
MATSVLPVGGRVAVLGIVGLVAYALTSAVQAQQVVVPPPDDFVAPEVTDTAALDGPRQPIFYRHDLHAGQYKMDCRYCHYTAEIASTPGMPSVSTCMGCHLVVAAGSPEIAKLREAVTNNEPVEWVEIHDLPPYVHFPHMLHVNATPAVSCQDCHGQVQEMVQVSQVASLKMGWCLDCHKARNVTTDCTACHY